jgi:2-dehydropantoate 2-reductase
MSARVLVVGAGALGGVMAAKLTRAGRDVSVIDANVAHVEQMNSPGLRVNIIDDEWPKFLNLLGHSITRY